MSLDKNYEYWDKDKISKEEQEKMMGLVNEKLRVKNLSKDKTDEENITKIDKELKDSPYYKDDKFGKEKSLIETNDILEVDLQPKISKIDLEIKNEEIKFENKKAELDIMINEYNDTEAILRCVDATPEEAEKELTSEQYEKWVNSISSINGNKSWNEALKNKIDEMKTEVSQIDGKLQKLKDQLRN